MKIIKCKCSNDYQDKVYGTHFRVCTPKKSGNEYRCTVCGTVHKVVESKK